MCQFHSSMFWRVTKHSKMYRHLLQSLPENEILSKISKSSLINQMIFRFLLQQVPVYQIKYCEKYLKFKGKGIVQKATENWVMDETYWCKSF